MQAETHLQAGRVEEALQSLQEEVRSRPSDARLRIFIFQVLSVLGQWERAATQLKVLADLDPQSLLLARVYEPQVRAEVLRCDIFSGKARPTIFGEPESWMALLLQGNAMAATGDLPGAQGCLQQALDAAPETPGSVNGAPCRWLADADPRFGPMLEAVIEGRYFWVPFFRIAQLRTEPPRHLRDLLWLPASFRWSNGGEAAGFIFSRYPATAASTSGELLLARKTEWQDQGSGLAFGSGQRLLATEGEDYPVLQLRTIEFAAPADGSAPS